MDSEIMQAPRERDRGGEGRKLIRSIPTWMLIGLVPVEME